MNASTNIFASDSHLEEGARAALLGHGARALWFSGLSGSGKSTIARALEVELVKQGILAYILDGDNIRMGLNKDLGFSEDDREENLRRIAEVTRLLVEAGVVCIVAFISPLRRSRERARQIIGPERFSEVYVSTSLDTCESRDVKGLYARARAGEIKDFTGIDSPFEPPADPELNLDTGALSIQESVAHILNHLRTTQTLPSLQV